MCAVTDVAERVPGVRARRRWIGSLAIAAVLVVAVAVFVHWRDSPHLMSPYGNGMSATFPLGVEELIDAGVEPASQTAKPIEIDSITPRVTVDTADATISLMVCDAPPINDRLGEGTRAEMAADCGVPLVPFHSGRYQFRYVPHGSELLLGVTMHRPGRLRVDGFQVHYKDGIRRGDDHAGIEIDLAAR